MKKIFIIVCTWMILLTDQIVQAEPIKIVKEPTPEWIQNLEVARDPAQTQMVIVVHLADTRALISMYDKMNGEWQQIMESNGFIGKSGLGKTKEGDSKTPVGTFEFSHFAFGIAPNPGGSLPYIQINANHYWSGDNNYKYNQLIDISEAPANFDTQNSEHLIDYDPYYLYGLNIGYNPENIPGKGSALFMHCIGDRTHTGGCVALPIDKMKFIIQNIRKGCVCVIGAPQELGISPEELENLNTKLKSSQEILGGTN